MNDEFLFLDTKISSYPEGDLEFGVFRKKGQQLKYVGKESTYTIRTLCATPSGVLNRLVKLTSGGGKPTRKIHRGNMDRRSKLSDPRKG